MKHGIFHQNDIEELSEEYRTALGGFNAGTIYFPSRIKYLTAIRATLDSLAPTKRHLILALNSSVSARRLSDSEAGFNFISYMAAFRKRADNGDIVIRIFCLNENSVPMPDRNFHRYKQLGEFAEVICQHGLQKCVNRYVSQPETFNCVYIYPLTGDDAGTEIGNPIINESIDIKKLLTSIRTHLDLRHSIIFREFLDYDPHHSTTGCGSRHSPLLDTGYAESEFGKYLSLANTSLSIEHANSGRFDIGLIVALPLEFQAIAAEVKNLEQIKIQGAAIFHRGTFTTNSGRKLQVLIALLDSPGNVSSGIAATLMVDYYKAAFIINLGIAGGIKGEVVLGDVVIGKTVLYYESKKVTTTGEKPDFKTLNSRPGSAHNIHDAERYLARMDSSSPGESAAARSPRATFDCTIASGEKVIGDPSLLTTLRDTVSRKTVACDNESAGVYMAVKALSSDTPVLAVRGISDYADEKKGDDWHKYAAEAAAAYVFEFMAAQ